MFTLRLNRLDGRYVARSARRPARLLPFGVPAAGMAVATGQWGRRHGVSNSHPARVISLRRDPDAAGNGMRRRDIGRLAGGCRLARALTFARQRGLDPFLRRGRRRARGPGQNPVGPGFAVPQVPCRLARGAWGWPCSCRCRRGGGPGHPAVPGCVTSVRGLLLPGADDDARHPAELNNQARGDNIVTSRPWCAAAIVAPAAIATAALATPATAAASPSWQLTDQYTANPACFTTGGGSEYLELNLNGTWSTSLTFGASGLSAGGSHSDYVLYFADSTGVVTSSSPGPIPPGSSTEPAPLP